MEIKHTVVVIKKPNVGEQAQYFFGEFDHDCGRKGEREEMAIRLKSTTDNMKLLIGKPVLVRYLPEERTDYHKEFKDWPADWHYTVITNIKPDENENLEKLHRRIRILEAQKSGLEHDRDKLCDFIAQKGTRMLVDEAMNQFEVMKKRMERATEEKKPDAVQQPQG